MMRRRKRICRHSPGDPNCSSNQYRSSPQVVYKDKIVYRDKPVPITPDADKYEILEIHREGPHLVVKAKYPNCAKCSYEGIKIMVFLNVSEADVIKWKTIDPHFRDPKGTKKITEAPGPAARFPASKEGWSDALAYVRGKVGSTASTPRSLWNQGQR